MCTKLRSDDVCRYILLGLLPFCCISISMVLSKNLYDWFRIQNGVGPKKVYRCHQTLFSCCLKPRPCLYATCNRNLWQWPKICQSPIRLRNETMDHNFSMLTVITRACCEQSIFVDFIVTYVLLHANLLLLPAALVGGVNHMLIYL